MSTFVSMPFGYSMAQAPSSATNNVFCHRFVPPPLSDYVVTYPSATTLDFQNPTSVLEYRESRTASSANVTYGVVGLTKDWNKKKDWNNTQSSI